MKKANIEKYKKMFLRYYKEKDVEVIIDALENINDYLLKNLEKEGFEEANKEALLYFAEWFKKEFKDEDLLIEIDEYFLTTFPLVFTMANDINEIVQEDDFERYDKYIRMFIEKIGEDVESIISALAYVNTYFCLRAEEDKDDFLLKNIDSVFFFHDWFTIKYNKNVEVNKAMILNWNICPEILSIPEELYEDVDEMDEIEQAEEILYNMDNDYLNMSYSNKANIDNILAYIQELKGGVSTMFVFKDSEEVTPIDIPIINKENEEEVIALEMTYRLIRGFLSKMMKEEGYCFILNSEEGVVYINGFIHTDKKTRSMGEEELMDCMEFYMEDEEEGEETEVIYEDSGLVLF